MDQQFKENVIKSFGMVKGDVTAAQATLADISLAIADINKRHEKLVDEFHRMKIAHIKLLQQHKELGKKVRAKPAKPVVIVRNVKAKSAKKKR